MKLLSESARAERQLLMSEKFSLARVCCQPLFVASTHSMLMFISRCSISCTDSVSWARILASSFSIFSICASDAILCAVVT